MFHSFFLLSRTFYASPGFFCQYGVPPLARRFAIWPLLVMVLILVMPAKGDAAPPKRFEIQTFSLVTTNNTLTVDLALSVDDEEGLYNLLKDGAVVELGIDIRVERKREWWSNATIASLRYTSVIRHDPLTREFFLTMPSGTLPTTQPPLAEEDPVGSPAISPENMGTPMEPDKAGTTLMLKDRNLTRLLTNSWHKLRLPLIPLSLIELEGHNQTYVISGSASLNHIETPPWLAQNSVFWSAEIIPPVTFSLEYFYQ